MTLLVFFEPNINISNPQLKYMSSEEDNLVFYAFPPSSLVLEQQPKLSLRILILFQCPFSSNPPRFTHLFFFFLLSFFNIFSEHSFHYLHPLHLRSSTRRPSTNFLPNFVILHPLRAKIQKVKLYLIQTPSLNVEN